MTRSSTRTLLLALGLVAFAGCNSRSERPLPPVSPQVAEFFAHLEADRDREWLEDESAKWLAAQPTEIRVLIAERALGDADPAVRLLAPTQFYVTGMGGGAH